MPGNPESVLLPHDTGEGTPRCTLSAAFFTILHSVVAFFTILLCPGLTFPTIQNFPASGSIFRAKLIK
jgi:hypothetical protein